MKPKIKRRSLTAREWENVVLAVLFCAMVVVYLSKSSWGAELTAPKVLTLDDCLTIAEKNHPDLAGAEAQKAIERGRLSQAAVPERMDASGNLSAGRVGAREGDNASYTAGISAGVQVFDANRTKYAVDSQRHSLSAAEADADQTLLLVRTNVKAAYMALLLADEVRNQQQESVDAYRKHLEQARGFYEAGSRPKSDVTKAEVDLGNAELALVEAQSSIEIARASLLNAMGVSEEMPIEIESTWRTVPKELEQKAETLALEYRSDYRSAGLQTQAGKATVQSEARYGSPSVTLQGGYSTDGDDLFALESGWNVGLSMNIPIVDGGATKARVAVAKGQVRSLEASQEALRQNILLDVRKALLDVKNSRERIRISELTVKQAEENYDLAEGRYQTGVGSALEITDALVSLTDARLSVYQARNDLQVALISLEQATGVELERSGATLTSAKNTPAPKS